MAGLNGTPKPKRKNKMSEIAGLMVLSSNYEFSNIVDNDQEIEITTVSNVQLAEAVSLSNLGWVQRASNVFAYVKPSTSKGVDVIEEIQEEFFDGEKPEDVILPNEEGVVEEELPPSVDGIMEDV
jgi:hypothetical protein